ncbi:MAG TPA: hypothetical protein VN947_33040 [Polyangia bacterium]|nr:hypothetical protein [Polyangia bacterium]
MTRRQLQSLVHDVGKYVARTARNLPPEPTREMVDMLVRDLYELRPGQHASAVFASLVAFAGAPPLDDVRALFVEIDRLEPEVRAGAPAAVGRAARIARDIEARLRALAEGA